MYTGFFIQIEKRGIIFINQYGDKKIVIPSTLPSKSEN